MKRTFELDDFIEALKKARELLEVSEQWEARLASYEAQESRLTTSIQDLERKQQALRASVDETEKDVALAIRTQRDASERAIAARRSEQDREMHEIAESVREAARHAQDTIAKAKADELAAQASATAAQRTLGEIQALLVKARDDAKKFAVLAGS